MPTDNRALDVALAKALGWQAVRDIELWQIISPNGDYSRSVSTEELAWLHFGPHFSRDWAGLGRLVEAMRQRGWWFTLATHAKHYQGLRTYASFAHLEHGNFGAHHTTEMQATTRAAARALGIAVEE